MHTKKLSAKPSPAKSVTAKNVCPSGSIHPRPILTGRKELSPPENCLPELQIDFAVLEDGSLVEVIEDPVDPNHALFAIFKRGRIRLTAAKHSRPRSNPCANTAERSRIFRYETPSGSHALQVGYAIGARHR